MPKFGIRSLLLLTAAAAAYFATLFAGFHGNDAAKNVMGAVFFAIFAYWCGTRLAPKK